MRLAVIITLLATVLLATDPALIVPPTSNLTTVEINWRAVPNSAAENGITETVWLDQLSIGCGTSRTITILDKQGSAITAYNAVVIAANTTTVIPMWAARFTGGFTIQASGTGCVYQFRGKVRR